MNTNTPASPLNPTSATVGNVADRAHQTVDRIAERATPAIERATTTAHQTVDRLTERATPALERASSVAHQSIDRVAGAAAPAAEWVAESGKALAERSSHFADACSNQVRAHPLATVLGALAVGYIVGRVTR